jgi:hypothetical protein
MRKEEETLGGVKRSEETSSCMKEDNGKGLEEKKKGR